MSTIPETIVAHHCGIKVKDIRTSYSDISANILTAGVCLQPDHQHVRGGVQHRHRHQPRGGHRVGQEEGRGHEGLRGKDGRDDHKQSLSFRT